jgi:hypothetical protein
VEIWGQVRPARGRTSARVDVLARRGRGLIRTLRVRTNSRGYFMLRFRRPGAARLRYQAQWSAPDGKELRSRIARAGRPIRYLDAGEPMPPRNSGR